jgi:hypothetical protein
VKHNEAIERVNKLRWRAEGVYNIGLHAGDAEAIATLLAAVSHLPVGGDGEPLYPGTTGWRRVTKSCGCVRAVQVEIDAVEVHGLGKCWMVRHWGPEGGLYYAKEIFSTCEAAEATPK